jgi:hypothetical protein
MDHPISAPLPSAVKKFHAGKMAIDHVKYPHLRAIHTPHLPAVSFPSLSRTGTRVPATKLPMGMTLPIMTRHGVHPLDTANSLPPIGNC